MNKYIVLVCGLNIRAHNRISLDEQRVALRAVATELDAVPVEDKGSYFVTSRHTPERVVNLVVGALQAFRPDLDTPGAAVAAPVTVREALEELSRVLAATYRHAFDASDYSIKLGKGTWRAGLALPLYPGELSAAQSIFHQTKNTTIFGWRAGCALVAKREARNVHWGSTVNDPVERLFKRTTGLITRVTSRSANILRRLVSAA